MDEIKRALLGDKEAQRAVTERGELLPCPKCHCQEVEIQGNGHDVLDRDTLAVVDYIPHDFIYVSCENCNYSSAPVNININADGEMELEKEEKELIADWNTRPQILTAEEMERLEGMECDR